VYHLPPTVEYLKQQDFIYVGSAIHRKQIVGVARRRTEYVGKKQLSAIFHHYHAFVGSRTIVRIPYRNQIFKRTGWLVGATRAQHGLQFGRKHVCFGYPQWVVYIIGAPQFQGFAQVYGGIGRQIHPQLARFWYTDHRIPQATIAGQDAQLVVASNKVGKSFPECISTRV
jgi:hypothetical protein